jgi:hypothetical protein
VKSTFAQEIKAVDVAVIAKLVVIPKRAESKEGELNIDPPTAKFEIVEVLKGADLVVGEKQIEVVYFDDKPIGTEFLIEGAQPPVIAWTPPVALTPRSHKYLAELMKLPDDWSKRLPYLMSYLGDKEELLDSDAYDEFALAPYAALKSIKDLMPHDTLVKRIQDPDEKPSRRRLYLTMLGVCGSANDLPMLEELLRAKDPKFKAGLDATVACYLVLRGADGLPFIEDMFLKKETDEYTDIYSVVMALRILGQEKDAPIPLPRIVQSMRLVLDHPRVADQAIMDLARWQDWSVMDRIVELFKSKDSEVTSWVRVPVVNYLRACPLPKAKDYIAELRKIDPKSVRQSETLYPIGPEVQDPSGQPPAAATRATSEKAKAGAGNSQSNNSSTPKPAANATADSSTPAQAKPEPSAAAPAVAAQSEKRSDSSALESRSWYIIVPAAVLGAFILLLVARGPRAKSETTRSGK